MDVYKKKKGDFLLYIVVDKIYIFFKEKIQRDIL